MEKEIREILEAFGNEVIAIIDGTNGEKLPAVLMVSKCSAALNKATGEIVRLSRPTEPEEPPPVLSDERINAIRSLKYNPDMDVDELFMVALRAVATAQRDADIKYYGGEA